MRLIDADELGGFASRYTEFDGEPLTGRERDLVRNVCGKISAMMPTARIPGPVEPEYLGENAAIGCRIGRCRCGNIVRSYHGYCFSCGAGLAWDAVYPGGEDGG